MNPPAPHKKLSRRRFLKLVGAAAALSISGCGLPQPPDPTDGLSKRARRAGITYGAAVQSLQLDDPAFAMACIDECAMLVPENELKWATLRPQPEQFDFSGYRRIAAFASANNLKLRGHVLVWHFANPPWLVPALKDAKTAESLLNQHIRRVFQETAPQIHEWDVVNEAVHPLSQREDGLRPSLWLDALGPDYIPAAFHLAHDADPNAFLVYNDYGCEFGDAYGFQRRKHILRLLENLKKRGVPVHGFGLQSHLQTGRPLGGEAFASFIGEIRDLGLELRITELDIDTSRHHASADEKSRASQVMLSAYLDMIQKSGPLPMLITWGLSDRYSWLKETTPHLQGALPLDAKMKRGVMWEELRKRFEGA